MRLCKRNIFFKPGRLGRSIFPLEMAWSSHLINVTIQKAEKKIYISLFSTIFQLYLDYKFLDCFGTTVHLLKINSRLSNLVFFWHYFSTQTWTQWKNTCFEYNNMNWCIFFFWRISLPSFLFLSPNVSYQYICYFVLGYIINMGRLSIFQIPQC